MKIGDRIKELRISNNMTMEELGEKLGVKKSAIYKYENGLIENLKQSTIHKLSQIFDVSPIYLMGWDNEESTAQEAREATARASEFVELFSRLTPEQQTLIIQQIKGILLNQ